MSEGLGLGNRDGAQDRGTAEGVLEEGVGAVPVDGGGDGEGRGAEGPPCHRVAS